VYSQRYLTAGPYLAVFIP